MIGWEGVDGIHYCFVKGFGEVVFAVNPSNLPGDYVHPLARSFEDFLRLLLACEGLAAVEQAHLWDREKFDAFLREDGPPSLERQAALEGLRDGLGLTPMEDSYGYIQEIQASFDYGKIPFRKEYYDCVPEALKRPERPEWRVYFGSGFGGQHRGRDKPGREIPIGKTFEGVDGGLLKVPPAGGVFDAELEGRDHQADGEQRPGQLGEKEDDGLDPLQVKKLHAHVPHLGEEVAEEAHHLAIEPVDEVVHDRGGDKVPNKNVVHLPRVPRSSERHSPIMPQI